MSIFAHAQAPAPRLLMRLALVPELLDQVAGTPRRILEIGPGLGDLSMYLHSRYRGAEQVLMDISEAGTARLRQRVAGQDGMTVLTGDFRALPENERFDMLVACEVFEHIEDDESAFAAAFRLLAPGGYFLFSVPAHARKWGASDVYAGHFRRYERAALLAQFARHGFEVADTLSYGFPLTHMLAPAYSYYYGRKLTRSPLSMQEATKRSGTERTVVQRFAHLPVASLMAPLFLCQRMVKRSSVGDGYLVLARRPPEGADGGA